MSPEEYVEAVLTLVEQIPPGRVMSYGAIAEYLYDCSGRGSSRLVGTIMARHGGGVPWHRVVNAAGRPAPGHEDRARELLEAEGARFKGDKVVMAEASWWPEDSHHRPEASEPTATKPTATKPAATKPSASRRATASASRRATASASRRATACEQR